MHRPLALLFLAGLVTAQPAPPRKVIRAAPLLDVTAGK